MSSWHNLESARLQWADAPYDDDVLEELLEVARGQVITYSPTKKADPIVELASTDVPVHYRLAQLRQATNLWTAASVDTTGGMGDGSDFVIRPHPLDWHVKQIIRPRGGAPRVR